jgi:hypothetical protein
MSDPDDDDEAARAVTRALPARWTRRLVTLARERPDLDFAVWSETLFAACARIEDAVERDLVILDAHAARPELDLRVAVVTAEVRPYRQVIVQHVSTRPRVRRRQVSAAPVRGADDRTIERLNPALAGRPDVLGDRTSLTLYEGCRACWETPS